MRAADARNTAVVATMVCAAALSGCGPNACDRLEEACPHCPDPSFKTACQITAADNDSDTCQEMIDGVETKDSETWRACWGKR